MQYVEHWRDQGIRWHGGIALLVAESWLGV
jgi:hypothetical protein